MTAKLRGRAFAALALLWTGALAIVFLPLLLLPRAATQRAAALWCRGLLVLLRVVCGVRHRVVGLENLPAGPAIVAAKHQSAWETLVFHQLLSDPVYAIKRELLRAPVLGWFLGKAGNIPIDREAGGGAVRALLPEAERALAEGAQIVIFPEGTRVAPGAPPRYLPGAAALRRRFPETPFVPVALDSGRCWPARGLPAGPGVITLEFLAPMPSGLDRRAFTTLLERRIEEACARLAAASGAGPAIPANEEPKPK